MEQTPVQKIITLMEVREAMVRSASAHSGSKYPAAKTDINLFYNSCIGCLLAIKQLQIAKEATITENLWKEINKFTEDVTLLRDEVRTFDLTYSLDAPLVKCLSRLMNKGDTVLREIRNKCNSEMLKTFGGDWMNETNEKYVKDMQIVIKDLSPCVAYSTARRAERVKDYDSLRASSLASNTVKESTAPPTTTAAPAAVSKPTNVAANYTYPDVDTNTFTQSTVQNHGYNMKQPAISGAPEGDKHVTFIEPIADNAKPELVGDASIPHLKTHEYMNLPQFTGVPEHSLPIYQQETPPLHLQDSIMAESMVPASRIHNPPTVLMSKPYPA